MKLDTLCVAILSAAAAGGVLAGSPCDVQTPAGLLVNESLDRFGYTRRNPVAGEIWALNSSSMRVLQVLDGGVLVERAVFTTPNAKNFFVKTSRAYADGDMLATGYYRAEGTFSYEAVFGNQRTVYAFSELSADQQQKIRAFMQDKAAVAAAQLQAEKERRQRAEQTVEFKKSKERIAAEEAAEKERLERKRVERENAHELAKLNAEKDARVASMKAAAEAEANRQKAANAREMARLAREREELDRENRSRIAAAKVEKRQADAKLAVEMQKERGRHAADALSAFDFNFKHHCVVQRSIRKNVRVEIVDPEWTKLADLQAKQDWLGMLGAIDGEEYDEFPSEKEIDVILDSLRKKSFCIFVKGQRMPGNVYIYAKRIFGQHGGGNRNGWGCVVMSYYDVERRGEKVNVAPFDGRIFITNGRTNDSLGQAIGVGLHYFNRESVRSAFDEKAEEIEEWLKLN